MTSRDPDDRVDHDVIDPLRRANVEMDDVTRARLAVALEAALDVETDAARVPSGSPWYRGRALVAAAAAIVLVGGATALMVRGRGALVRAPERARPPVVLAGSQASGAGSSPSGRPSIDAGPRLTPYLYSGPGAERETLDPTANLVVPAGAQVHATLGPRIRLTLVGPGRLAVEALATGGRGEAIGLALEGGRLLVDFDGHAGGVLTVRSPGAVTTVVGTLFSVDGTGGQTRVAVARGRVSVRAQAVGRTQEVASGVSFNARDGVLAPISREVARALAAHEAAAPPPAGGSGLLHLNGTGEGDSRVVTFDRLPLAAPPLVARVPAGDHWLGRAGERGGWAKLAVPESGAITVAMAVPGGDGARDGGGSRRPHQAREAPASARELDGAYAAAEAALRAGAPAQARQELQQILARDPAGEHAGAAHLDLARLALADGDAGEARRHLEQVSDPALAEAAHHLRCRIDLMRAGSSAAVARATLCLVDFRRRYPTSPHDAEALALLAARAADCNAARPLLDEYLRRYPTGPFAADARARLAACRPPL